MGNLPVKREAKQNMLRFYGQGLLGVLETAQSRIGWLIALLAVLGVGSMVSKWAATFGVLTYVAGSMLRAGHVQNLKLQEQVETLEESRPRIEAGLFENQGNPFFFGMSVRNRGARGSFTASMEIKRSSANRGEIGSVHRMAWQRTHTANSEIAENGEDRFIFGQIRWVGKMGHDVSISLHHLRDENFGDEFHRFSFVAEDFADTEKPSVDVEITIASEPRAINGADVRLVRLGPYEAKEIKPLAVSIPPFHGGQS